MALAMTPPTTLEASANQIAVDPGAIEVTRRPGRVSIPFSIPRDQEYYWHRSWQAEEREALAERDAGKVFRFDSDDPEDAARFLDEADRSGRQAS